MEKRAIIAIILTFFVIMAWGAIQSKFFPPPPPSKEVKQGEVAPAEKVAEKKIDVKELKPEPQKELKLPPKTKAVPKREVTVETENYWATFTNEDARLKHFKLKKYEDRVEESPLATKLIQFFQELFTKKTEPRKPVPLDLVNTTEEEGLPLGISLITPLPSPSHGTWEVEKEELRLVKAGEKGEITFVNNLENGLKISKRYGFTSEDYTVALEVEVQNNTSQEIPAQLALHWTGRIELRKLAEEENKDYGLKYAYFKNQKVEKKELGGASSSGCTPSCSAPKKSIEPFEFSDKGEIGWYTFEGEYFAAVLVPPPSERNLTLSVKGNEKNILTANLVSSSITLPPKQTVKIPYKIYLGPKKENHLAALGANADKLIDFGFFSIVAKPLLWFLRATNSVTHNFGIDIIILSILIKIIFLPLTQISFKSMKEMQKVQPEMARLKETYKNDKARLQQEIMLLYKRRKINPMSGCLPMLIQIPVFIALYNALQMTIEMRHAPFFLWLRDLSAKDPIYITPIIMGVTMVIQQKMTPSAADPAQAKLFMLMPIMFTFLFLSFPSGLVIYWLITNVLSIAHQYYLNKKV